MEEYEYLENLNCEELVKLMSEMLAVQQKHKNLLTFPDFGDILHKSIKVDFRKSGHAPLFLVCENRT